MTRWCAAMAFSSQSAWSADSARLTVFACTFVDRVKRVPGRPGGGFPTGKFVGLFCLHTGRLLAFVEGAWKAHGLPLARRLRRGLRAGEVLVADRADCGWHFLV